MTTTVKKRKPVAGKPKKMKSSLPLPPSSTMVEIGGKEYVITAKADFEDWYEDQILAAIAAVRLKAERDKAMPLDEVIRHLDGGRQGRTR